MKPTYLVAVSKPLLPLGNFSSHPTEISTACPIYPAKDPNAVEHPQNMNFSLDIGYKPMGPEYDSILAIEHPPESTFDLVVQEEE